MKDERYNFTILNQTEFANLDDFVSKPSRKIFSDEVIFYLDQLSKILFKDPRSREYPDVGTFAFYCRKGNINTLKKEYHKANKNRLGRGLIFHISPSNVPVNFAYSLIAGLLSGNKNIVRVPTEGFEQIEAIIDAIDKNSENLACREIADEIMLIRYKSEDNDITDKLSALCDVRVIWGGDETIGRIRDSRLSPRAFDVTFSDRYSICIINGDSFISEKDPSSVASGFYNDTYLFDQNACTSPHLIVWLGDEKNVEKSKNIFWSELEKLVDEEYVIQPVQVVDKLTTFFNQALEMSKIELYENKDNLIWRVKVLELEENIDKFRCNSGYFSEYHADSLTDISFIINSRYQTVSYYGFDRSELEMFILENIPKGVDRIVPIGSTMDFSLRWDGYNLINTFSRTIEII